MLCIATRGSPAIAAPLTDSRSPYTRDPHETLAWLRLLRASGGDHTRIGVLETTPTGRPVRCSFTTVTGIREDAAGSREIDVLRSLLVARPGTAVLVVADDEVDGAQAKALGTPVFRCPGIRSNTATARVPVWLSRPTDAARRALARSLADEDASAPLERLAWALDLAFEDQRVRDMSAVAGLETVVTVSFCADVGVDPGADTDDLVARLWRALSRPARAGEDGFGAGPLTWAGALMPFQQEGVRALLAMDRLLLADDMGLGKTVQTIAALRVLKARGQLGRALVIAPTSVLDQWRRELAKWAPELRAIVVRGSADDRAWQWRATTDVMLASYGVVRADGSRREVGARSWGVVVADEAQRIKNRIEVSDVVKQLRRQRSWALSGTPVENREDELASIMEFVDHDGSRPLAHYVPGQLLRDRHRALQLRRRKADVLADLPEKLVSKLAIELHPVQRVSYDRAERDGVVYLKSLGAEASVLHILELITRLKQVCNADPRTGASSKLDDIASRIEQLSERGHKALVFSQYTGSTAGVAAAANKLARFEPLTLTGATPLAERPALIETFRRESRNRVMIVSLHTGGLGLNLQEASYVFHLDRWWNPAVERQAEDRAHRMGQTAKVHVVKYACANTIEERIDRILETKQALFDQLIDDVSLDLSASLNRDELLGLFGLGAH